ncbi:MAG: hypothetical protein FWG10_07890 [Eubacteriaceae bacterium]|nr:hypothetical protein [Eubacteriaceae bacterium]
MSLQQERNQLYWDLWAGKIPARAPIEFGAGHDYALDYFDYDPRYDRYNPDLTWELADKVNEMYKGSDTLPMAPTSPSAAYRYIKQAFMVPQSNGFFQHPNIVAVELDELPEFSKDIFKYYVDVIQPRVYGILQDDPVYGQLKIQIARQVINQEFAGKPNLTDKYECANVNEGRLTMWAPFDFVADYIRSFSTILVDLRRKPQYIIDACEASSEFMIEQARMQPAPNPNRISQMSMPLHMAPYMKPSDAEKFYFPTYYKTIKGFQDLGFYVSTHAEQDFTPHIESMNEVPGKCRIKFEHADPKKVVAGMTGPHIIEKMYHFAVLRTGTVQDCIDQAKELLDIVMPTGKYIFSPSKSPLRKNDTKVENAQALIQYLIENAKYERAGESYE